MGDLRERPFEVTVRGSVRGERDLKERFARNAVQEARQSDRGEPTQGVSVKRTPVGGVTSIHSRIYSPPPNPD
jgi:hypothetical protein